MSVFAPRYVERFRCLGSDCPDDCCHDWSVLVDDASAASIAEHARALLPASEVEAGPFVTVTGPSGEPRRALRLIGPEQRCVLQAGDRLCRLHSAHGEEALSVACAIFPRSVDRIGEVVEVTASLGCPEVARLVLRADDAAEVVELDGARLPRDVEARVLEASHPYAATFLDVRGVMLQLARLSSLPLPGRLLVMAQLAADTRPFYRHDLVDGERLDRYLRGLLRREVLVDVARHGLAQPTDDRFALGVVLLTLELRHQPDAPPAFRRSADRVLSDLGLDPAPRADPRPPPEVVERALAVWQQRREALSPHDAARVDEVLARYVEHFWMRYWFTSSPSLWAHAYALFLRVAVLRVLLVAHPALRFAPDPLARLAAIDEAAIEVVYSFARLLDHSPGQLGQVLGPLGEAGLNTVDHARAFIRL